MYGAKIFIGSGRKTTAKIERSDSEVIGRIFGKPVKCELDKAAKNPKTVRSKRAC